MTLETGLLIGCIVLALLGVLSSVVAWLRQYGWGRIVQGIAFAIGVVGLYLTGLLELLWNGVRVLWDWVNAIRLDTVISTGVGMVLGAIVLWLIGAFLFSKGYGRLTPQERRERVAARKQRQVTAGERPGPVSQGQGGAPRAKSEPVDDEMAEIEAILRSRGIE